MGICASTGQLIPRWRLPGTGDVLSGMTVGLLAQKLSPFDAASAAVYLHVAASELVSKTVGATGLLASDLLPQIPRAIVEVGQKAQKRQPA